MSDYILHLRKNRKLHPILYKEFRALKFRKNIHVRLITSIMSQQLSTKVADVIFKRFLLLFNGKEPTAEEVLSIPKETYRSIGLSNAKAAYMHNVVFAQLLNDDSEIPYKIADNGTDIILKLPKTKPPYVVPVVEFDLK